MHSSTGPWRTRLGVATALLTMGLWSACGSSDSDKNVREGADDAGLAGGAGEAARQQDPSKGGSTPRTVAGAGGATGDLDEAFGGANAGGADAGGAAPAAVGGMSPESGGAESGSAGASGNGGQEVPPKITSFGCFVASGDGWDFLASSEPAVLIPGTPRCGGQTIGDNVDGFAPELTPTSIDFRRSFVIADDILAGGDFTLSFAADDAVDFALNGEPLATCSPPGGDIGMCSASCQTAAIPAEALRGGGDVNVLDTKLTNLLSVDAGGGNWGWTSITYSICVTAK